MLLVGAGLSGLAEPHHEPAVGAELVDLMAQPLLEAGRTARIAVGCAIGDPHEPFAVNEQPMRKVHQPLAEALDGLSIEVDLDDRIEIGFGAPVGPAPIEQPQMLPFGIRLDPAGDADLAVAELVPRVVHLVRVVATLSAPDGLNRQAERRHGHSHRHASNHVCHSSYLDSGSAYAMYSPEYVPPLTATTMYWRPLRE